MKYIVRKKLGNKKFYYVDKNGVKIVDKKIIKYADHLPIPPMYHNTKIFLNSNKVIAIGIDDAGRKQYIYKPEHVKKQTNKKYSSMVKIGKHMPKLERDINKFLKQTRHNDNKMIATVLRIMLICNFRIGNGKYKELYESYGITTITKKHITINGNAVNIKYVGKKGVINECNIKDGVIVGIIKAIYKKRNSKEPFFAINATKVNDFLKSYGGMTSKNLRTWNANVTYLKYLRLILKEKPAMDSASKRKKLSTLAIEKTAENLHHTKAICKKSYINNAIINIFVEKPELFVKYLKKYESDDKMFMALSGKA